MHRLVKRRRKNSEKQPCFGNWFFQLESLRNRARSSQLSNIASDKYLFKQFLYVDKVKDIRRFGFFFGYFLKSFFYSTFYNLDLYNLNHPIISTCFYLLAAGYMRNVISLCRGKSTTQYFVYCSYIYLPVVKSAPQYKCMCSLIFQIFYKK